MRGVVEARVARVAIGQARREVICGRPEFGVVDDRLQPLAHRLIPSKPTRIQQAGKYTDVLRCQRAALRGISNGVTHLEADVPQRGEELL